MCSKTRRGFTLIELLVVILVIAILALIVVPRVMNASERARRVTYDAHKHMIRGAVEQFHTDCGVYPSTLNDLYATSLSTGSGTAKLAATTEGYTGFVASGFKGPYIVAKGGAISTTCPLPANPYIGTSSEDPTKHWAYASSSGSSYTLEETPTRSLPAS